MLRKAVFLMLPFLVFIVLAFVPDQSQRWTAVMELEGHSKPIILVSDAIYGGYNSFDKKFFFTGKNHMFISNTEPSKAKVFNDFCTTNNAGLFEFELNGIENPKASKEASGNISFKKKFPVQGNVSLNKDLKEVIEVKADFKKLGLVLTPEAAKIMTGKFKLTIKAEN